MIFFRLFFPLYFTVLALPLQAQEVPFIRVTADKKQILLGEPFRLTVEARFPATMAFALPDTLAHFEFLSEPVQSSSETNGMRSLTGVYQVTSFDSGHWVIPSFRLNPQLQSDTIGIDVLFSDFNPDQPYHDIKDIIEVPTKKQRPWWWYAAGGALLLLLLLYFLLRRNKTAKPPVQRKTDPYAEALRAFDALQKAGLEPVAFYSGLTDIFRLYVYRRKGILSLQKTTDDLVLQLKESGLAKTEWEQVAQALRLSDFVKFAKYRPGPEENQVAFTALREAVKSLERSVSPGPHP